MIVEEVAHFTPSPLWETLCCSYFRGLASDLSKAATTFYDHVQERREVIV
jgi:hypothetical protein